METEYPEVDWLFWPAGVEIQKQPLELSELFPRGTIHYS